MIGIRPSKYDSNFFGAKHTRVKITDANVTVK